MNSTRFAGRTVVITGGAGGLGSAIAIASAEQGASVGILDTNQGAIDELLSKLREGGFTVAGRVLDVRDSLAVKSAFDEIAVTLGRIDILITAAGGSLGTPRDLDEISDDDLDLVLDVNVKGTFYCVRAAIPHMKKVGGGAIVTFSSIGGRSPSPVTGIPYAASKAAILGLTRRLAKEVAPDNIRVNAIAPGLFLTDRLLGMFEAMTPADQREVTDGIPLGRIPKISECVNPVLFLASEEASYITGTVLDVNGGRFMAS